MIPDRISEYIRFVDDSASPVSTTDWTISSPDTNVWVPSITTDGVVSFTDGGAALTTPVIIGLDGLAWNPAISNDGVLSVESGDEFGSSEASASLLDSDSVEWFMYVDADGIVNVTTSLVIPVLFRYPSISVRWTPTAETDTFTLYSLRAPMTIRQKTS